MDAKTRKMLKLKSMAERGEENEREVAAQKLHEMMKKYGVTRDDLETAEMHETEATFSKRSAYKWTRLLAVEIGRTNYCKSIYEPRSSGHAFIFVGLECNVEASREMFEYLQVAVQRAGTVYARGLRKSIHRAKKVDLFRRGFIEGVILRLRTVYWGAAPDGAMVAKFEESPALKKYLAINYPDLSYKSLARNFKGVSARSYYEGIESGRKVSLDRQVKQRAIKQLGHSGDASQD
jgi:hypothetical protein